jgi:hypothetical protein
MPFAFIPAFRRLGGIYWTVVPTEKWGASPRISKTDLVEIFFSRGKYKDEVSRGQRQDKCESSPLAPSLFSSTIFLP